MKRPAPFKELGGLFAPFMMKEGAIEVEDSCMIRT